jgi:hypothetical protein
VIVTVLLQSSLQFLTCDKKVALGVGLGLGLGVLVIFTVLLVWWLWRRYGVVASFMNKLVSVDCKVSY